MDDGPDHTSRLEPSRLSNFDNEIEQPIPSRRTDAICVSDIIAETLRDLDIPYLALNPGSSYRGLHDSIVNHLGNKSPKLLLCLHEEHAVAIAHGYAKITHRPMAAAVHSNVGLLHASMAIYNAWCDRLPVIVIGATGPVDAAKRRPWIDWIHTSRDQGAIVRNFVKWDDQPTSAEASREALLRGNFLARTVPMGPVYINFDAELQEAMLSDPLPAIDPKRFMPYAASDAPNDLCERVAGMLAQAKHPLILMGRVSRSVEAWQRRIELAEAVGARVITSRQAGAAFPTDHPLHVNSPTGISGQPGLPGRESLDAIKQADMLLSLDWIDLAGTLRTAWGGFSDLPPVIQVSMDHQMHNGWSMDHHGLPVVDILLASRPDDAVVQILKALPQRERPVEPVRPAPPPEPPKLEGSRITLSQIAYALKQACGNRSVSLLHVAISWSNAIWPLRHPLDYIGSEGGGGIGAAPGVAVGGALALKGSNRLPVCVTGDGDFVMGVTALWTAVHYRIPLLFVVYNNRSFFNDEVHQQRMAELRGHPIENKWIGMRMTEPEIDLAKMAEAQGAVGFGPVKDASMLVDIFSKAIAAVDAGHVAVVDVHIPAG